MRVALIAGLVLAVGGIAAAGVASAQAPAQDPAGVIAFLDKNADGKCDLNEYLGFQVTQIPVFDKNGDGELSEAEFKDSLQGKAKQTASAVFQNFNERGRTLNQREFLGYHAWVFKEFVDTNRDGFMSAEEWAAVMKKI